jgi:carboxypeptidase family protein
MKGHLTRSVVNSLSSASCSLPVSYFRVRVWVVAALLLAAPCMRAQQNVSQPRQVVDQATAGGASIHGVVTGEDGSVYQGVHIALELTLGDDPIAATQETDDSGAFNFEDLPAGTFKITISSAGFATKEISGELRTGEAFDARTIVLPMASAESFVRVSAESQAEITEAQLNIEEQQRVLGFFPNYYVSYDPHPMPLTTRQKYKLAWRTSIDPITWVMTGSVAGMEQASNRFVGYGQGAQGYAKRFGASYADMFTGTMLGGAVLPSVFRQDPRYFYKGTGSVMSRVMYAIANAVICKGDSGHWQPNYSGILGGIASGGISNLYYPSSERSGVELTFENTLIGTAQGAAQNLIQEFVVRRLTPRLPNFAANAQ